MALSQTAYSLTATFPQHELYGLTSQIRRASVSIAANIAEGYGREHTGSFVQFLRIAQGSLKELETLVLLSARVGVALPEGIEPMIRDCDELGRMMRALIRSLQTKQQS